MNAYSTAGWENFLIAEVGAAAALSGLVFVAVSINLTRILALPRVSARAGETLFFLMSVLAVASCGLVPGQSIEAFGGEILGIGVISWGTVCWLWLRDVSTPALRRSWLVSRLCIDQMSTVPLLIAGMSTLGHRGGGLYWLVPGVLCAFAGGMLNAWVLLVGSPGRTP
jgi:modulator of FtsH protease